jgi:uncharacterized cupin superfamily protein
VAAMNRTEKYVKSELSTQDYEPFMVGGKQAGEVHWLAQANSSGQPTYSGLWRCEPMTFEYEFPGDEVLQVIEGDLEIQIVAGEKILLKEGDIASFDKGIKSVWTVKNSFKKFFVISNC